MTRFDRAVQIIALVLATAGLCIFSAHLWVWLLQWACECCPGGAG